jgi:hypothetical protein
MISLASFKTGFSRGSPPLRLIWQPDWSRSGPPAPGQPKIWPRLNQWLTTPIAVRANDQSMVRCQTCGRPFDERAYQVVVSELGSFESIECAEKALRRHARRSGDDIATALLKATSNLQPQAVDPPAPAVTAKEDQPD